MGLKFSRQDRILLMNTVDKELTEVFPEHSREELRSYKRELLDTAKAVRGKKKEQYEKLLEKENKRLMDEIAMKDAEVKAALAISEHKSEYTIKTVPNGKLSATAVMMLSDIHFEEVIDKRKVNGLNEYNPEVAEKRLNYYFTNSLRLLKITSSDVKIDKVVICILGDCITGSLREENLETNAMRPVIAIMAVQDIIDAGIKLIQQHYPNLAVACVVGNHPRLTKKVHYSTEQGNSLEYYMYCNLAKLNPDVEFSVAESAHLYLDLYGYPIRILHGHQIRYWGGISGIFTPIYKALGQWEKAKRAHLTLIGHFHQQKNGGIFITNGSCIGYSPFALSIKADYEIAQQKFFLFLSNGSVTMESPIFLEKI